MTQPFPKTYQELRWLTDMDPSGADTSNDLESLEQDVMHIIGEVLGSNLADPHNGVGAIYYLNGTSLQLAQMPQIIDAQLASVSRIGGSQSSIALQADGTYAIAVKVAVGGQVLNFNFNLGPGGLSKA